MDEPPSQPSPDFSSSYVATFQLLMGSLAPYREFVSKNRIHTLPDDVLTHIFHKALFSKVEEAWPPTRAEQYHPKDAICLSHVCQRFYALITEDSRFWDWPCSRRESRELMRVCIERSKEYGLRVEIDSKLADRSVA